MPILGPEAPRGGAGGHGPSFEDARRRTNGDLFLFFLLIGFISCFNFVGLIVNNCLFCHCFVQVTAGMPLPKEYIDEVMHNSSQSECFI